MSEEQSRIWMRPDGTIEWRYQGVDVFFPQQELEINGKKKLRGGMPLCVPWHGKLVKGEPQHGVVRGMTGEVVSHDRTMRFSHSADERCDWGFCCVSEVRVGNEGAHLRHTMTIARKDDKSGESKPIAPGLHPYLATLGRLFVISTRDWVVGIGDVGSKGSIVKPIPKNRHITIFIGNDLVVITPQEPYKEVVLWTDTLGRYICVEPVARRTEFGTDTGLWLAPGSRLTFECDFQFMG